MHSGVRGEVVRAPDAVMGCGLPDEPKRAVWVEQEWPSAVRTDTLRPSLSESLSSVRGTAVAET
ncbi:hypothetical protein [Streptomyces sp. MAI_2237]